MKVSQNPPATQVLWFPSTGASNEADHLRLLLLSLQRDGALGDLGRMLLRKLDEVATANAAGRG